MKVWPRVEIGDVASIERTTIQPDDICDETQYLGLEHIESGGAILGSQIVKRGDLASSKFQFTKRHLLYGKLRPYLAKIACPKFEGICSTDILPVLPGSKLDRMYLCYFLRQPSIVALANSQATGANLPRLSPHSLAKIEIPLPPLAEQKRIAEILDCAEELRRQRRAALALLDELVQSIFMEMFGDPETNPKRWPTRTLQEIISIPLRNGLSPSKSGKVHADVLTLSAITGTAFDPTAVKRSTFISKPPNGQSVNMADFLICRGNGNLNLVGRGYFPISSMHNTTFPDTMIAARIDTGIERAFLELVWNSRSVRTQIEASARTTNGTYKVNQLMLETVTFICPPIDLQRHFANHINAIRQHKAAQQSSAVQTDALFASLQHRAFRGEL